ncbi:MAG: FAD-binding protein [Clostridia bacterium]|nr:FAD-binding protein [Clostridia bacterium]
MRIVVCIRQGQDGEINPFDAAAYEAALRLEGAEITLLSMGPLSAKDFLTSLTRLGAKQAILLSDRRFAGADTLATAYTLSLAIQKLTPDLVVCGRQTLIGDTAQTGIMLATRMCFPVITNVMGIHTVTTEKITCHTRTEGDVTVSLPALLTLERIYALRLPRLRSKTIECQVWNADDLGADPARCGLAGSPTRVLSTRENQSGRRRCKWISLDQLDGILKESLSKEAQVTEKDTPAALSLPRVWTVGDAPLEFAPSVSNDVTVLPFASAEELAERIRAGAPSAVLWGSDPLSKRLAAQVAAQLDLGLCADCNSLETDGQELFMIRPALSGSVIAKIRSIPRPAMATVRTTQTEGSPLVIAAGFGAKEQMPLIRALAEKYGADLAATRKMVDHDLLPYDLQVGLTGKSISPAVYLTVGVSGAVHHLVGMQRSGTVIAVNPDRTAPIFDYADYGILAKAEDLAPYV